MQLPLHGVKVLDLSRVLAGPFAGQILGDLGADVIKIEDHSGDPTRQWTPPCFGQDSVYFLSANRNKRGYSASFTRADELAHVQRLALEADIVIENFRVGGLAKFGLDYETLRIKNPRLIYCSITGFGQTGPESHRPGYDALIQATGGLMSITGPSKKQPIKVGVAITDLATGMYGVIGILAALRERDRSGHGQWIDLALQDCQISLLANIAMNYLCTDKIPEPLGNAHPSIVPYESFEAKDKSFYLAVGSDEQFQRLCLHLGIPKLAQEKRYQTNAARVRNRGSLIAKLQKEFRKKKVSYWLKRLDPAGIPIGPIRNLKELSKDPHVIARGTFTVMDDGKTPCLANPLRFSRTPIRTYRKPPKLKAVPISFGGEMERGSQ